MAGNGRKLAAAADGRYEIFQWSQARVRPFAIDDTSDSKDANIAFVSQNFFDLFSYPFSAGSAETALADNRWRRFIRKIC